MRFRIGFNLEVEVERGRGGRRSDRELRRAMYDFTAQTGVVMGGQTVEESTAALAAYSRENIGTVTIMPASAPAAATPWSGVRDLHAWPVRPRRSASRRTA